VGFTAACPSFAVVRAHFKGRKEERKRKEGSFKRMKGMPNNNNTHVSALMASRGMADGGIKTLPDALTQMEQLFSSLNREEPLFLKIENRKRKKK
jgi:hypothetical protein